MNVPIFLSVFLCKIILIYSDEVMLSCADLQLMTELLWKYVEETECIVHNLVAKHGDNVIYQNLTRTYQKNPYNFQMSPRYSSYRGFGRSYNDRIGWKQFNILEQTTESVNFYHKVNKVVFKNSSIPFIPQNIFTEMPRIKVFDISATGIETIELTDFYGATNIVYLYMSNNKITQLTSDMFYNMTRLSKVDVSHNQIVHLLEDTFSNANELTHIKLSNNRISELDENVFSDLIELETIELDHNLLDNIHSNMFENCLKLKIIKLNNNHLTEIDCNAVGHLNHLSILDLSENSLIHFDSECLEQKRLSLNISHNKIYELNLQNWYSLDATNNGLIDLHISVNITYNNRELRLGKNSIKDTKLIFKLFEELEYLDLSDSLVGNITSTTLINLNSLKHLYLRNCSLSNINCFGTFSAQKELLSVDISYNNLSKIDFVTFYPYMKRVKVLNIDGNNLTSLKGLSSEIFPSLTRIGISKNHFQCLDITKLLTEFKSNELEIAKSSETQAIDSHHVSGIACEYDEKTITKANTTQKPKKQMNKSDDEPHPHHFLMSFIGIALIACFIMLTYKVVAFLKNKPDFFSNRFLSNFSTSDNDNVTNIMY